MDGNGMDQSEIPTVGVAAGDPAGPRLCQTLDLVRQAVLLLETAVEQLIVIREWMGAD